MKKLMLVVALVAIFALVSPAAALDNGGGGQWKYMDKFPFTNVPTTYAQYCIQINGSYINVTNTTGALKVSLYDPHFWQYVSTNGTDLRFTNQQSQLYFYIMDFNSTSEQATIWVNVTPGSTELDMYYGNPLANKSIYDNPDKTFLFFDDFSGTALNTSKWIVGGGIGTYSVTVSNGILTLYASGGSVYVQSTKYFNNTSVIVISRVRDVNAGFTTTVRDRYLSSIINLDPFGTDCGIFTETAGGAYYLYWQGAWTTIQPIVDKWVISKEILVPGSYFEWIRPTFDKSGATTLTTMYLKYVVGDTGSTLQSGEIQFDWIFVAHFVDPVTFGTPSSTSLGTIITNVTSVSVKYNAHDLTGELLVNNSTTLLTPPFGYFPSTASATGYLAVGSTTVPGLANITIYLDSNLTLNKVICNGTVVTPSLLGTYTSSTGELYNVYNFTSPSAGLLVVYANATPVVATYNDSMVYMKDIPEIPIQTVYNVAGVNTTYGANVTYLVDSNLTVTSVIYNGTAVTPIFVGNVTANGHIYHKYTFFTNESGELNISTEIPNVAYNTKLYVDGALSTVALCGEPISVVAPVPSTIAVGLQKYVGTTANFTVMSPKTVSVFVQVFNVSKMLFGYHSVSVQVVWGHINLSILDLKGKSRHFDYGIYNLNYNKVSQNPDTLYAGMNKITVYYLGMPIKTYEFYLNHTNNGMNITLTVNATSMSCPCYNFTVVSPDHFNITNLHKIIPYGKFEVSHAGEVIINFSTNAPVTVTVSGNSYTYSAPYLYIYGSGNATVTSYYKLHMDAESALGIPMNVTVLVNSMKMNVYGSTDKVLPVDRYTIRFPENPLGFVLKNTTLTEVTTNLTTSLALPTAIYKVPTHISLSVYKINTTWFNFKFPFPLPFTLSKHATTKADSGLVSACISGTLYNWYGSPVPDANLTVKITSVKTGYTVTKTVNTGTTGSFTTTFNVSTGVNYTITVEYAGSPVYVGSKQEIMVSGGALPPAPQERVNYTVLVVAAGITALAAGVAAFAYYSRKKRLSKAMIELEKKSRFFRRVK